MDGYDREVVAAAPRLAQRSSSGHSSGSSSKKTSLTWTESSLMVILGTGLVVLLGLCVFGAFEDYDGRPKASMSGAALSLACTGFLLLCLTFNGGRWGFLGLKTLVLTLIAVPLAIGIGGPLLELVVPGHPVFGSFGPQYGAVLTLGVPYLCVLYSGVSDGYAS